MAKLIQSVEFFVVGGPVQADRACYIERRADQDLLDAIVGQRFAYVLAARGSGKSSLMIRTSRALRADERLTAVVDLRQIGAHGESSDASRWYYSIAHRIVRELRLRVELQSWWQDRSALSPEQRFAEYFADIVLANTSVPVTILIDEIEQAAGLPFATEFFAVIRNCYTMRASEPDYSRLNFAVFGVASPAQLCPDENVSPFVTGEAIELRDFTIEECYRLEPGFGLASEAAYGLIDRIFAWTSGQPYLTQKLARAVARRGGRLEDVERSVQELFLSPNAAEEQMLSRIRRMLTARRPAMRGALLTLKTLVRGGPVQGDAGSPAQTLLVLSGVARRDDNQLVIRNRILRQAFTESWIKNAMPFNWRGLVAGGGIGLLLVLVPYWYMTYLPRPYLTVLSQPDVEFDAATAAYTRLHRLPGFANRADSLYAEVLSDRSRRSDTLQQALEADVLVRTLPERDGLADALLGEFWLRRSAQAIDAEDRDAALLYAATAMPYAPEAAEQQLAAFVGEDYRRLERTVHLRSPPMRWGIDWSNGLLAVVADDLSARSIALRDAIGIAGASPSETELTALQHEPFVRELSVDSEGSAGDFDLQLTMEHSAPEELTVTLAAPSGTSVTVQLTDAERTDGGFNLDRRILAPMADEPRQGVWRLTIIDGQAGNAGVLHRWSLVFDGVSETWFGAPQRGVEIPDPIRTRDVAITMSESGRLAVARPGRPGATGALALWDLQAGRLLHDLRLDRQVEFVEFTPSAEHLVAVAGNELLIWSTSSGMPTAHVETQTRFLLAPAISVDGSYVAIAEEVEGSSPLFSLIRVDDGQNVRSLEGVAGVAGWALGPAARYLALFSDEREIEIMDPRTGALAARLDLDRGASRVLAVERNDLLVTIDAAGDVHVWRLAATPNGVELVDDWHAGRTSDPDSLSVAADASTLAFAVSPVNVVVLDTVRQRMPVIIRVARSGLTPRTALASDGATLLTANGTAVRLWDISQRQAAAGPGLELSALTIGAQGRIAALGFRGGYVRAQSLATLGDLQRTGLETVDFIGHRGPVSALALEVGRNLIASGGEDGVVRTWNLATATPADALLRHGDRAITVVALDGGGQWLVSGSESSAQLWNVGAAERVGEYDVNGSVTAVRFAARSGRFAIGDSAGNVFVATIGADGPRPAFRADGAIRSLVFTPAEDYVVSGDEVGQVRAWPLDPGRPDVPPALELTQAVRWLGYESDGQHLLVQTEAWFHRLTVGDEAFSIVASRLLPPGLEPGAAATEDDHLRLIGGIELGRVNVADIAFDERMIGDLDEPDLRRDWGQVLGYVVNEQGVATRLAH